MWIPAQIHPPFSAPKVCTVLELCSFSPSFASFTIWAYILIYIEIIYVYIYIKYVSLLFHFTCFWTLCKRNQNILLHNLVFSFTLWFWDPFMLLHLSAICVSLLHNTPFQKYIPTYYFILFYCHWAFGLICCCNKVLLELFLYKFPHVPV